MIYILAEMPSPYITTYNGLLKLIERQIYSSPWQPAFGTWAFNYTRSIDRFNPSTFAENVKASNPVPSWPHIDLMLTHGPPFGIRDTTWEDKSVGCEHLRKAAQRCRPRLHCFGHIHESWGAERMKWSMETSDKIEVDRKKILESGFAYVDLSESGKSPLKFGEETMFINAAIMDRAYKTSNAPWVVDIDLSLAVQPNVS